MEKKELIKNYLINSLVEYDDDNDSIYHRLCRQRHQRVFKRLCDTAAHQGTFTQRTYPLKARMCPAHLVCGTVAVLRDNLRLHRILLEGQLGNERAACGTAVVAVLGNGHMRDVLFCIACFDTHSGTDRYRLRCFRNVTPRLYAVDQEISALLTY